MQSRPNINNWAAWPNVNVINNYSSP